MAETIHISGTTRKEIYESVLPQIISITSEEKDLIANLANITAILKEAFDFFWIGFYLVKQNELVLGPFQGPLACTRISLGKGVCGSAWKENKTLIVPDVEAFPGHIACSSLSKSEIVIPITVNQQVVAVLDVDSKQLADFNEIDQLYLEKLCQQISAFFSL